MSGVVTNVSFERDAQRRAVIGWTVEGSCELVEVAWAATPDGLDHRPIRTVAAARGSVLIEDVPAGRVFVAVAPAGEGGALLAGERNLGLQGAKNFRDLGGYPAAGGTRTRWGRIFRSDALVLEDLDFETFASLGIRSVYDLRSNLERETTPNRLPDAYHTVAEVALIGDEATRPAFDAMLTDGEAFLADLYLHTLESSAGTIGAVLSGLADETRLPAVFHCAAGKDRTGLVAAVLLSVLGVSEKDVLDDYELTSRYRSPEPVHEMMERLRTETGVAPEVVAGVLRTPRWAMQSALAQIRHRHGGFDGYLSGPGAVDPVVPATLRRLLLTS
jgi:protein-tyrosine phosphatase